MEPRSTAFGMNCDGPHAVPHAAQDGADDAGKTRAGRQQDPRPAAHRRRRHPLVVLLAAALAALCCAMLVNPRVYILLAAIAAVAIVGCAAPGLIVRGVKGEVRYEQRRGAVGKRMVARLVLCNRWPWPVWGLVVRGGWRKAQEPPGDDAATLAIARIGAWRRVELEWRITPLRRGRYPLLSASLESAFPFGFRRARRSLPAAGQVLVWPRTIDLRQETCRSVANDGRSGLGDGRRNGVAGEVLGARPYQPGDSTRRIHWRQTARHERLIICEFSSSQSSAVELSLGAVPPAQVSAAPALSAFEAAVSTIASLAKALAAGGTTVVLRLGPQTVLGAEHAGGLRSVLDALATVTPQASYPSLAGRHETKLSGHAPASARWVVTTAAGLEIAAAAERKAARPRFLVVDDAGRLVLLNRAAPTAGDALWQSFRTATPMRLQEVWRELNHAC